MSNKDTYHDVVIRALIKDGWTITGQQVRAFVGRRRLWIDLEAVKGEQNLAILIEVKGFETSPSQVEELYGAVGQYAVYKVALMINNVDAPLYLAVPTTAHQGILSEQLGREVVKQVGIKLLVFDPEAEEIVQWLS
jgi:hypothetical protein